MNYRRLGATGLRVSEISYGTWLTVSRTVDERLTREIVAAARERGINFFDTADVYNRGGAERLLGAALKGVPRHELVVATKCYFPVGEDPNNRGLSRKHIMEACHASLGRLSMDYVDLYQCHRYDDTTPLEETCRAMDDLIHQGKVLYWGVSQWSAPQIVEAVAFCRANGLYAPISNQPVYNMMNRSLEIEVMRACSEHGLGIVVYSPLAQGILTGKYTKGAVPGGSRGGDEFARQFMERRLAPEWIDRVDALRPIAESKHVTLTQLALAWVLRRSEITSAIVGASTVEQLVQNIAAVGVELSQDESNAIDVVMPTYPVDQYTGTKIVI
jgi:voltage-dependent potassium channel beta subunit